MVTLEILRDPSGVPTYVAPLTDAGQVCSFDAGDDISFTVPALARICVFGYQNGSDYWVATSAITIPSTNTPSNANYMLNPPPLKVTPGQTLHVKCATAAKISLAFYG
jgi:hypothetical protein